MKRYIAILIVTLMLFSAFLTFTASAQVLGYKEPASVGPYVGPSYVAHGYERTWTTCPNCGEMWSTGHWYDVFYINGSVDHTDHYPGMAFWCPACGYGGW